jgi:hypothetical protein
LDDDVLPIGVRERRRDEHVRRAGVGEHEAIDEPRVRGVRAVRKGRCVDGTRRRVGAGVIAGRPSEGGPPTADDKARRGDPLHEPSLYALHRVYSFVVNMNRRGGTR